ncbi:MAG: hypothetical protein RR779_07035 [Comamonas sp.]
MSLNLDARQRAMLQEMGHPLWWPESPAPAAQAAAAEAATPVPVPAPTAWAPSAPLAPAAAATPLPQQSDTPASASIALQPAPALAAPMTAPAPAPAAPAMAPARAAPQPQALPPDFPRVRFALRAPVLLYLQGKPASASASQAAWLVVAELPEGAPQQGPAGQLLVQMLRAMRLGDAPVYWVPLARIAANQEDDDSLPSYSIDALVQECQPAMALLLGLPAVRHLIPGEQPFSQLRQTLHHLGSNQLPAVVSYDPSHLLRTPQAKAATWADLCFALAQAGR